MSNPRPPRLGSLLARAVLAAAVVVPGAACVQVVSLGSGSSEGEGGAPSIPIDTRRLQDRAGGDPIDWGDLHCEPGVDTDLDGDGFSPMQGDCNDCDPDVGPDAVELPTVAGAGPAVDENCNGLVDEASPVCDQSVPVDASSPYAAARALDICTDARHDTWGHERWGVLDARWVLPDGAPEPGTHTFALGHGILDRFGPNVPVRHGARLLALSSGTARQPADEDYRSPAGFDKSYSSAPPEGFPVPSPYCPTAQSGEPRDGAALELTLRAPQNARGLAFDFDFYTYELPGHVCTESNDLFVALLRPSPQDPWSGNIAFDAAGDVVSVNTVLLEACDCDSGPPCAIGSRVHACTLGAGPLLGTGFGEDTAEDGTNRGATGWLTSTAPASPGATITIRFSIHDAANGNGDSTVLLDHFRWLRGEPVLPRSHTVAE